MNRPAATSLDVARAAGVSQSAVSRVFTPGASVSARMAEKVREAARDLGYRPNILARSLITGRSRIIGLVVAYLENQFYPDAVEKLSTALQARGYHLLIFTANANDGPVDAVLEEILDYQVDGIIMASASMSNRLAKRCEDAGLPVVLFNRAQDDWSLSFVTSDNRAGGRRVAEHLVACGHTRIAHIAGWEGSSTGRDRAEGFELGMAAAGLKTTHVIDGMYNRDTAAAAAREIFSTPDRPDAVFVGNDHMAFAVMDTLRFELGLRVPDDVAVIGYDDVPLASWPAYDLTTLRQPSRRMVDATVSALMARIEDGDPDPRQIRIDGPLIIRGSTRQPQGTP